LKRLKVIVPVNTVFVVTISGESVFVGGKRSRTTDTDLRLCRFFGLSNGYRLRAQAAYDTEVAERTLGQALRKIKPWSEHAA
jgi:plasmid maintenance system antidote protein VapI